MSKSLQFALHFGSVVILLLACAYPAVAQNDEADSEASSSATDEASAEEKSTPEEPAGTTKDDLAIDQAQLADKYRHLEEVMLKLAELTASTDPRRAAVLRQVVELSRERDVPIRFEAIIKLLENERLALAVSNQQNVQSELEKLLELLLKEDRASRIEDDKRRIQKVLKDVNRIIKLERGTQARTEGGDDLDRVKDAQGRITEKTRDVASRLDPDGAGEGKPGEGKPGEGKPGEGKPGEGKPGEGKPGEGKPGEGKPGEGKPGEGKPGEGKPGEGKPGQGQPGQGQPGQGEPGEGDSGEQGEQSTEAQAKKRIQAAQERMEEAERRLAEANRSGAAEEQKKAIEELEKAKAELEEILRQLREEEIERMLAMLEARFRKMLEMQIEVHEGTLRLDRIADEDRDDSFEISAGRLSRDEALIVREADKALTLLREEGSAIAFPEAVGQMRDDMEQIVVRLAQQKTSFITQGLEEDVILALEEMIEALKKAQKEMQEKKQQGKPQQGQPQDQPLVDSLAELKMIRALQMRINTRTERYSKMIEGEQAEQPELLDALERLSERQLRVHRVTRDLHLGKNK